MTTATSATSTPPARPRQLTLAQAEEKAAAANTVLLEASERELEDHKKAKKAAQAAARAAQVAARTAEDRAAEADANAAVLQRRLSGAPATPAPAVAAPVSTPAPSTPAVASAPAPVDTPATSAPAVAAPVAPTTAPTTPAAAPASVVRTSVMPPLGATTSVVAPATPTPALSKFDPRGWNWKKYWWLIALCVIAGIIFADRTWAWFAHDWYATAGGLTTVILSVLHWAVWPLAGLFGGGWWSTVLNERRTQPKK